MNTERRGSVLVLGLGNPILGDDGVGWVIANQVKDRLEDRGIEVDCHVGGGLSLMERLVGYDRVILVDAITTGTRPVGSVTVCDLEQLANPGCAHLGTGHDTTLPMALRMGRALGAVVPEHIELVGVEASPVFDLGERLSDVIACAVPEAVTKVMSAIDGGVP